MMPAMRPTLLIVLLLATAAFGEEKSVENKDLEAVDAAAFAEVIAPDAVVKKLGGGYGWAEGPAFYDGKFIFSDVTTGNGAVHTWTEAGGVGILRKPSNQANGHRVDPQGRLVACESSTRRVVRTEKDGTITVLADRYEGKRFNSPNDVVVRADGSIWFTDPPYNKPKDQPRELDENYVFCITPKGELKTVADDFDMPNGVCFSPDQKTLYIADSGKPHHVRAFDVTEDWELTNGRVFCTIDPGAPDGIRCDEAGRFWSAAADGVHVFSTEGKLIGKIKVPEKQTANLSFGESGGRPMLLMTACSGVYGVEVKVRGAGFN